MKFYCGIDIGKQGAIVVISETGISKYRMPLINKILDIHELSNILSKLNSSGGELIVGIENLKGIFGAGKSSTFTLGHIAGATEALLIAFNISFIKIQAKEWQKMCFEGIPEMKKQSSTKKTEVRDTKSMALLAQKRLYPTFVPMMGKQRTPDDGIIDALLIAHYLKTKH